MLKRKKLFIGIDISKETIDVALLMSDQPNKLPHNKFDNNVKGYKSMMRWIKSLYKLPVTKMLFCVEHTGHYSLNICSYFNEKSIDLWLENPMQIKRSLGIKRGKSDKIDARCIASYAHTHRHKAKLYQMPGETILTLKNLLTYRERLTKSKAGFQISSNDLKLCDMGANSSICSDSEDVIEMLNEKIKKSEEQMKALIYSEEKLKNIYELITSVKSLGFIIAVYTIVYTNAFTTFSSARQFACYCGIAPFENTSGTSLKGKTKISPMANKKLKSLFNMAAFTAIRWEPELKAYYKRKIDEGKPPMSVVNAIRNKLMARMIAVVKRGTPYVVHKWAT